MKLKSDAESVENLSAAMGIVELSNLLRNTKTIKELALDEIDSDSRKNLLDIDSNIQVLRAAIKLHTKSIIYVFDIEDEWCCNQGYDLEGIGIWDRIGNQLCNKFNFMGRDSIPDIEEIIEILKKEKISEVYTGNINGTFLGLSAISIDQDSGESKKIFECSEYHEEMLEKAGINVKFLDTLV